MNDKMTWVDVVMPAIILMGLMGALAGVIPFGFIAPDLLWIQQSGAIAFLGSIALFVIVAILEKLLELWKP